MIAATSLSTEEILKDIYAEVSTHTDGALWKEFFDGGTGATLAQTCAGLASFLAYQARAYKGEGSPLTAKLKSSIYALAYTFGYPINRRLSAKVKLRITVTTATLWQRTNPIGYLKGKPLSLLTDKTLPVGTYDIECYVGEWVTDEITVAESVDYYEWIVATDLDCEYVDNVEIEVRHNNVAVATTRYLELMDANTLLQKQLINGISILFGSPVLGRPAKAGDILTFTHLKISKSAVSPEATVYSLTDLKIDSALACTALTLLRRETLGDNLDKIAQLIPGYYAARRRMINPSDHEAIIRAYPAVVDAKFAPGICTLDPLNNYSQAVCEAAGGTWGAADTRCCTSSLSYTLDSGNAWTLSEEDDVYAYIQDFGVAGANLVFRVGTPVIVSPEITVVVDLGTDTAALDISIANLLKDVCYQLGGVFNTAAFVQKINGLSGVVYCYLHAPTIDRKLSWYGYFKPGTITTAYTTDTTTLNNFTATATGYTG